MSYERPYYRDLNYHPLLFYVIFGVKDEELKVSREKHHVDGFPEGLDFMIYDRENHESYMESLLGGSLGDILNRENHDLFEAMKHTDRWAVIRGEVEQDDTLDYMRNTNGFIQALRETGAGGVLDLQTFSLYSAKEWTDKFFDQEFNPFDYVTILSSESEKEDGTLWLHTRGMRKFGRPDIGMENVPVSEMKDAASVINQMIYYGSLGAFFSKDTTFHIPDVRSYLVKPQFVNDFDNPDFNNAYYRILWPECK